MKLLLDFRLKDNSGIGVYIKNIVSYIDFPVEEIELLVGSNSDCLNSSFKRKLFDAKLYSIKELVFLSFFTLGSDLFWSPHYNIPLFNFGRKLLVTIHDVYHLAFAFDLTLKQKLYAKIILNRAVENGNAIITVSEFSKSEIMKYTGCPSDKISVIYNGSRQEPILSSEYIVRDRYNLPDNFFLFVGNVKPHKNLKVLIEAFHILSDTITSEYKIVIVGKKDGFITGDSELMAEINSNPKLHGKISFTGFVDDADLDTIYSLASIFVFPSYYEGFGLPPLEAMLNSCPVITSNAASMPEVCGDAAVYFDPHDARQLADKIDLVVNNKTLRSELVEKGRERVKQFTWQKSADQHLKVINTLLNT